MRKIYSVLLLAFIATVFSCSDDSLDPLRTKEVKKGKLLALRGTQLNNLYGLGVNGAEFFPGVVPDDASFDFDAEYLSDDLTSLTSFDIYAVKRTPNGDDVTLKRVKLTTIPFSQFKTTKDYSRPWVSVSIPLKDILKAIDIADPNSAAGMDELLSVYGKTGIAIESDLNLSDGSILPSSQIVAQGLFESDQFYPAMRLSYSVVEFCPYEAPTWNGLTFRTVEIYDDGSVSDFYDVKLVSIGNDEYTIQGLGGTEDIDVKFTPAEITPHDQVITFISEEINGEGYVADNSGGSYDQCSHTFSLVVDNDDDDDETFTVYQFDKPRP